MINKSIQSPRIESRATLDTPFPCATTAPYRLKRALVRGVISGMLALLLLSVLAVAVSWGLGSYRVLSDDPTVWQSSIDRLNAQDTPVFSGAQSTPLLFVGSSTIRQFRDLGTIFPNQPVLKKGFGGAKIGDVAYYKNDLILQYQPKLLVLYIGTNDLIYNKNPDIDQLAPSLFSLLAEIRQALSDTPIVLLAQRPITNADHVALIREYNMVLADYASQHDHVYYVNINQSLLNPDGSANQSLLHWDGVHLNQLGYQVWGKALYQELNALLLLD